VNAEELLSGLRAVAGRLAGTQWADKAMQDVRDVEAIVAGDVSQWETGAMLWLASRLHPEATQLPAVATASQTTAAEPPHPTAAAVPATASPAPPTQQPAS
jgi:hypothetical protein